MKSRLNCDEFYNDGAEASQCYSVELYLLVLQNLKCKNVIGVLNFSAIYI